MRAFKAGPKRRRCEAGFTLVEALAALMLLVIVAPVAVRAVGMAAQIGVLADRRAQAVTLADTKLNELLLSRDWRYGDETGEFDEVYGEHAHRFQWLVLVDDWNESAFSQVTAIVTWRQRGDEQSVALSTVVYDEDY